MIYITFKKNKAKLGEIIKLDNHKIVLSLENINIDDLDSLVELFEVTIKIIKSFHHQTIYIDIVNLNYHELQIQMLLIFCTEKEFIFNHESPYIRHIALIHNNVRTLASQPPNVIYPQSFIDYVHANYPSLQINVFSDDDLLKEGLNLIHSVGKGSTNKPRLMIINHIVSDEKPVVLIGKGVTYDSGGYSLKSTPSMLGMKMDKTGGAIVVGLFDLLNKFNVQKSYIGLIPLVENMVSNDSYKNDDVIVAYNKLKVEITNTDAEGRLILADAIAYSKNFNPERIIDIATLTAVNSVFGDQYGIVMGTDHLLMNKIIEIGNTINDKFWKLPYNKKLIHKCTKSESADIKNSMNKDCCGYSIQGACFLHHFVPENVPWVHVDIGGLVKEKGYIHGFRTLAKLILSI